MELRALRYFVAVYEELSLTAAAQRCFVSQPSVSTAIAALEAELGTTLFVRHRKGVAPTADAQAFYARARALIGEAAAAMQMFRAPDQKPSLTIALSRTLDVARTMRLIAPLVGRADFALVLAAAEDRADARIISRDTLRKGELFVPLWTERYVVALPAGHEVARKNRLFAREVAALPVIARCHCEYAATLGRNVGSLNIVAVVQSEEWAMGLVRAGIGVAVAPEGVVPDDPLIAIRRFADIDPKREIGVAYGADGGTAPHVLAAVKELARIAPQIRAAKRGR